MPKTLYIVTFLILALCAACDNPYSPDSDDGGTGTTTGTTTGTSKKDCNVTLRVANLEQVAYNEASNNEASNNKASGNKASGNEASGNEAFGNEASTKDVIYRSASESTPVGEVCTRLSFAVYDINDDGSYTKVGEVSQTNSDNAFGTADLSVTAGTHLLVVIAHNGTGKPTMTNPEKITFPSNKTTDTFFCTQQFSVSDGGTTNLNLNLKRAVAKVCFSPDDKTPSKVTKMKFYYTGGSSTFNAVSGYGCVNSKQTEERPVVASAHEGSSTYSIYTFPRSDSNSINLEVTALDNDTKLYYRKFSDIPITLNYITRCHGNFFGDDPSGGRVAPGITIDTRWSSELDYTFDSPSTNIETE